jgi:hypothetical protein
MSDSCAIQKHLWPWLCVEDHSGPGDFDLEDTGQALVAPLRLYPADINQRTSGHELPSFRHQELAISFPDQSDKFVRIFGFNSLGRPHMSPPKSFVVL